MPEMDTNHSERNDDQPNSTLPNSKSDNMNTSKKTEHIAKTSKVGVSDRFLNMINGSQPLPVTIAPSALMSAGGTVVGGSNSSFVRTVPAADKPLNVLQAAQMQASVTGGKVIPTMASSAWTLNNNNMSRSSFPGGISGPATGSSVQTSNAITMTGSVSMLVPGNNPVSLNPLMNGPSVQQHQQLQQDQHLTVDHQSLLLQPLQQHQLLQQQQALLANSKLRAGNGHNGDGRASTEHQQQQQRHSQHLPADSSSTQINQADSSTNSIAVD